MKIIRIPTFWTAEQANTIHEFLGELRAAVWQEYHEDIEQLYEDVLDQNRKHIGNDFDDDVKF
jgi:hypothetical protein